MPETKSQRMLRLQEEEEARLGREKEDEEQDNEAKR